MIGPWKVLPKVCHPWLLQAIVGRHLRRSAAGQNAALGVAADHQDAAHWRGGGEVVPRLLEQDDALLHRALRDPAMGVEVDGCAGPRWVVDPANRKQAAQGPADHAINARLGHTPGCNFGFGSNGTESSIGRHAR